MYHLEAGYAMKRLLGGTVRERTPCSVPALPDHQTRKIVAFMDQYTSRYDTEK